MSNPYKNDLRGHGSPARPYHCACCTPPRQIYYRLERPVDRTYHERDHTPAVAAASLAAVRRDLAARRRARHAARDK